jgi:hypothetical protein
MAEKSQSNRGIWIASLILLVILGAGGYFAWTVYQERQKPAPVVETKPVEAPDAGPPSVNLAEGDEILKNAAADLSADEQLAKWLAVPDLVRRLVGATFLVSRGESPHELLLFLQPAGDFAVDEVEDKKLLAPKPKKGAKPKKGKRKPTKHLIHFYMSSKSTSRYDLVAKVLDSVNTEKLGALYAKLSPYAEAAFREAAPPGKALEGVYNAAVDHLAATPLSDDKLELIEKEEGIGFAFKDPKLEELSRAQKHLIRMGPANARTVLKKLEAFRTAVFAAKPAAAPSDAGH